MNIMEFLENFPTEEAVISHFVKVRYPEGIKCPFCSNEKVYQRKERLKVYQCGKCHNNFSVFKDTIFEKSDTDLRKWMYAIHLFLNAKKGVSGYQLQREIKVTYKTAWRMLKQIRTAMGNKEHRKLLENSVLEMDECYIGGKPRKRNDKNKDDDQGGDNTSQTGKRGRGTKKVPVVGVIDRKSGRVHVKVALPNKQGKKLTGKQLMGILEEAASKDNIIITDEFKGYNLLDYKDYVHFRIDHTKQFVDGDIHTNNMESFWATLKRGILGIYHHVSVKYLQKYLDEFCFRFENRDNSVVFNTVLKQSVYY